MNGSAYVVGEAPSYESRLLSIKLQLLPLYLEGQLPDGLDVSSKCQQGCCHSVYCVWVVPSRPQAHLVLPTGAAQAHAAPCELDKWCPARFLGQAGSDSKA